MLAGFSELGEAGAHSLGWASFEKYPYLSSKIKFQKSSW